MPYDLRSDGKHTAAECFHKRNMLQVENIETMLREHLAGVLQKGYYGTAGISLTIHDGIIQQVGLQTERTWQCDKTTGNE